MDKKFLSVIFLLLCLSGCSDSNNQYVCKNYDQIPTEVSLSIKGKILLFGTGEYKYCESKGNMNIYHTNCIKNENGNYESSIWFDSITKELSMYGSGGFIPVQLFRCRN
jgi:hypothetical protein